MQSAPGAGLAGLDRASPLLSTLSAQPELFLHHAAEKSEQESKVREVADDAKKLMKVFFDAALRFCPYEKVISAAEGLDSLVIDDFDHSQVWEELEVQNVPLRRHIRRHLAKLIAADAGAWSLNGNSMGAAAKTATETGAKVSVGRPPLRKATSSSKADMARDASKDALDDDGDEEEEEDVDMDADDDVGDELASFSKKGADKNESSSSSRKKTPVDDEFFKLDEMEKFADEVEAGKVALDKDDDDEGSEDGLLFRADDDEDDEDGGRDIMYSEFFEPSEQTSDAATKKSKKPTKKELLEEAESGKSKRQKPQEEDLDNEEAEDEEEAEEEDGEEEADLEDEALAFPGSAVTADKDLEEEEKQLEAQIRKLQEEGEEESGESEDEENEGDEGADAAEPGGEADATGDEDEEVKASKAKVEKIPVAPRSLYDMDKQLQSLEEEVAKLEEEQLEEKHWSLAGEVSAKQRPLNSLLEMALDQPMTHFAARRAAEEAVAAGIEDPQDGNPLDEVPGADGLFKGSKKFDIEAIIRQRVWDETYDDVVKKDVLPPSKRPQVAGEEDAVEVLNFEKSRVGLGDIYAKQYEAEMLNHKTKEEEQEDEQKKEAKATFAKLMHKLDMLTNATFTPRQPMSGFSAESLAKVPSLKMEETIPLMVSEAFVKAPEEVRAPMKHVKTQEELTHEEKKAVRRNSKAARKKKLEGRVTSGEMTVAGMRERTRKLQEKNALVKKAEAEKGQIKERKKKLNANELLSQAAKNASSGATRKEVVREERAKQLQNMNTAPSKKLKL
mmetsp:Transcript_44565/g.105623  ORF Transcript_44565/g.105623 Transcript_44565/m.105623 type:complete len:786 (+) Transcript_44565:54-2411(+)